MRGFVLAAAFSSLPMLAWAQAGGGASGTLLDEPALATTTTESPASPPAEAAPPAADTTAATPNGVAAPGISVTDEDAAPPTQRTHAQAAGVAAPGVNANAGAQHAAASQRTSIEPQNALERAFVTAAHEQSQRAAFRRIFLDSQVALATVSNDANAAPRVVTLGPAGDACLIFTSDARATQIMGARSPRQMMTGREALQRLRGARLVIININLDPYLTLDSDGVSAFLAADTAPPVTPRSAGPAQ